MIDSGLSHGLPVTAARGGCPVCGGSNVMPVLSFSAPRLCNLLFVRKDDATAAASGDVSISYCRDCTHVFNSTFENSSVSYTTGYDSSLEHSQRFAEFADVLARRLEAAYSLAGKTVVEIGCGKGDFLNRLCAISGANGIGFDTTYEDAAGASSSSTTFVRDYFSSRYTDVRPDLVVCRHVLEHIDRPVEFLRDLRAHPNVEAGTYVYFEVPNALYTLRDHGIWDLIYEHASYFTMKSLCTAFELAGFEVLDTGTAFGDQYIYMNARASPSSAAGNSANAEATDQLVASFAETYRAKIARWTRRLTIEDPGEIAVWGAGSKGITFVNVIPGGGRISALVDLNPNKQGRFAPRYGTPVAAPHGLKAKAIKTIVVMNPMYADEIARATASVAAGAELILA